MPIVLPTWQKALSKPGYLNYQYLLPYFIKLLIKNYPNVFIICRWGAPARLLSDQGREFVAKVNDEACREFGIKRSVTSAYHPQTNGVDKRTNQTLKQRLSKLVNEHQNNWCDFLDEVAYSIRTQRQASTKYTPFYLMFGRNPNSAQMVFIIFFNCYIFNNLNESESQNHIYFSRIQTKDNNKIN